VTGGSNENRRSESAGLDVSSMFHSPRELAKKEALALRQGFTS